MKEGKTLDGQPPISELILNCAYEHLSEEVLLRTPEESYERKLHAETKQRNRGHDVGRSQAVEEWQTRRKQDEEANVESGQYLDLGH